MKMQEKVKNTDEINFGMEVDLLTEEEISPYLRKYTEKETISI